MSVSLELEGVSLRYPSASSPALDAVSCSAQVGTLTAIVGPNGAGKSSLLRVAAGFERPQAGRVTLRREGESRDPCRASRDETARWLTYLPARPLGPADTTALAAVLIARHPYARGWLFDDEADVERATAALTSVGAEGFAARPLASLSSGERQRVFVARALCQDVGLLLLDEPTSAQDPAHAWRLLKLLKGVTDAGRTVVCALHDLNLAAAYADQVLLAVGGAIRAQGTPAEVLTPEVLSKAFGLRVHVGEDEGGRYVIPRGVEA